jgi:hypothetical protein
MRCRPHWTAEGVADQCGLGVLVEHLSGPARLTPPCQSLARKEPTWESNLSGQWSQLTNHFAFSGECPSDMPSAVRTG